MLGHNKSQKAPASMLAAFLGVHVGHLAGDVGFLTPAFAELDSKTGSPCGLGCLANQHCPLRQYSPATSNTYTRAHKDNCRQECTSARCCASPPGEDWICWQSHTLLLRLCAWCVEPHQTDHRGFSSLKGILRYGQTCF